MRPLVFDIARGSFADGPGIRTVVFFKGCPLRCLWCQNPESQQPGEELLFYQERCIKCGNCETGCNSLARQTAGRFYTPPELARLILRDKVFYKSSSGGVTFSGGEPLLYIDYLYDVSSLLKQENIHIAVETCGYFDYRQFGKLLPLIDLYLYDIKLMDPVKHEQYTGKSNEIILDNFRKLLQAGAKVIPRIPLVPGYTAAEENLSQIAGFFARLKIENYVFLPYNPSGIKKWRRLGKKPPVELSPQPLTLEKEREWVRYFKKKLSSASGGKLL